MTGVRFLLFIFLFSFLFSTNAYARGNIKIKTYQQAKKIMYETIYSDHRFTFYCNFPYEKNRSVDLPSSFVVPSHFDRANRVETEHVVPVENFGKTFAEWREGHPSCVSQTGKPFKGRKCVELVNPEFLQMEADLHNLFPSVGVVNAIRGNANFQMLPETAPLLFGPSCPMRKEKRRVEPPEAVRGTIARTYLYMDETYERYRMSAPQRRLMEAWDRQYPPSSWECERARRIRRIQGNPNPFVERQCS